MSDRSRSRLSAERSRFNFGRAKSCGSFSRCQPFRVGDTDPSRPYARFSSVENDFGTTLAGLGSGWLRVTNLRGRILCSMLDGYRGGCDAFQTRDVSTSFGGDEELSAITSSALS